MARKNRILIYINCIVLALHSIFIFSVTTVPVFALSVSGLQGTIASIIVSLMLQAGVAPVNNAWLTALNNSYGLESSIGTIGNAIESGLLTETANGLIDTGLADAIAAQPAYTDLGIAEIFTTTADDVGVIAGSGAVNLSSTASNVGMLGSIGQFAGAVGVGVGAGILINHLREAWINFIRSGAKINLNADVINNVPSGYELWYSCYGGTGGSGGTTRYIENYYYAPSNVVFAAYDTVSEGEPIYRYSLNNINTTNSSGNGTMYTYIGKNNVYESGVYSNRVPQNVGDYGAVGNWGIPETNAPIFGDIDSARAYLNSCRDNYDNKIDPVSPDLIGQGGNHVATYNPSTGEYEDPAFINQVPEGYEMKPVNMDDYLDFVEEANDNTDNGETGLPQAALFEDLINSLLQEPSLVPDQGVDIPTIPDRPVIPEQPETPGKDPISPEEQDLINSGLGDTGLANVFPFCIPFDLFVLVGNLKAGREAPVIVFEFPEQFGWGGIEIDLSAYDEAAQILRHMELLLFIIGLAVNTRSLIGAVG